MKFLLLCLLVGRVCAGDDLTVFPSGTVTLEIYERVSGKPTLLFLPLLPPNWFEFDSLFFFVYFCTTLNFFAFSPILVCWRCLWR